MDNTADYYKVSFELYGFGISPPDITKSLNIRPTLMRTKGENILHRSSGKVLRKAEESRWLLESNLRADAEVEEQLRAILDLLKPHKKYITQNILSDGKCMFRIGGYTYSEAGHAGLDLSAKILRDVSDYNADIDIDIYVEEK